MSSFKLRLQCALKLPIDGSGPQLCFGAHRYLAVGRVPYPRCLSIAENDPLTPLRTSEESSQSIGISD